MEVVSTAQAEWPQAPPDPGDGYRTVCLICEAPATYRWFDASCCAACYRPGDPHAVETFRRTVELFREYAAGLEDPEDPLPRRPRRPPPPHRRPRRRIRARPATMPPMRGHELLEYLDIPKLVRNRAPPPRSDHRDYLTIVTAALIVCLRPKRQRDRPTIQQVWTAYDQLRGGDGSGDGRALYSWFDRFRVNTEQDLEPKHAIDDALALRDTWRAMLDDPRGPRERRSPDA
jgi:hypothetical protein